MTRWPVLTLILVLLTVLGVSCSKNDITVSTHELKIKRGTKTVFFINTSDTPEIDKDKTIQLVVQHEDILRINESVISIHANETTPIEIEAIGAGHSVVFANTSSTVLDVDDVFVRVTVFKIIELDTFSLAVGWIYFLAWSISFYPQIYYNWQRKSVVGLNFDFIILNLVGFTLYALFNLGLYLIPEIQQEYLKRNPRGLNPVKLNDIVFAVHAAIATLFTLIQCFIYEREGQRVSTIARIILSLFGVFLFISVILAAVAVLHWLDFLYYCSYVKLTITLIKYVPQAYMNYRRKSTVGWSIGNIFLDFTGGSLSMLQMIVDSYNYDDWRSIFGDPTKFGLGLFSVAFDIFFIVQHYVLYRHTNYEDRTDQEEKNINRHTEGSYKVSPQNTSPEEREGLV
ncbi:unnamed protein product [Callosobruchus maculatus]|nr:unnamed protein product [Callosobruchus maculatus]